MAQAITISERRNLSDSLPIAVAILSAAAGGIHGTLAPEHAKEHWSFGAFFLAAAAFQVAWSFFILAAPSRRAWLIGATGNAAIAVVWILSRTSGLPMGPSPWQREAAGFVDVLATLYELAIVVVAIAVSRPRNVRRLRGRTPAGLWAFAIGAGLLGVAGLIAAQSHPMNGSGGFQALGAHLGHLSLISAAMVLTLGVRWAVSRWRSKAARRGGMVARARRQTQP